MSNIGLSTDLVLANTTTRPGTLVLPLSTQIPGRTITIKDATGAAAVSSIYISTSGGDTFEDGSTTQALTTSYGFIKVTAKAGKWYMGETTQPNYYTASTVNTTITQATSISTAAMNVSSLSLLTDIATSFTPLSVTGCKLWLDGSDASTITLSGANVTIIRDKASSVNFTNSGTVTQSTIGAQSALYFGGSGYLSGNISSFLTGTAIIVFKATAVNNNWNPFFAWYDSGGTRDPAFGYVPGGNTVGPYTTFGGTGTPTTTVSIGTSYLATYSWTGTTTAVGFNGATPTAGTQPSYSDSQTLLWIGYDNGGYLTGIIGEILLYNSVLGQTDRQNIEGYLAQKWGLSASLPAGHPGLTRTLYKSVNYVAPSTQSFYTSSSLAYWGPYLLNSGFRTAQPQIFFKTILDVILTSLYYQVSASSWTSDWQPYLQWLTTANAGATISISTSITGASSIYYRGFVLAPNGLLYGVSGGAGNILVFNPNNDTVLGTISFSGGAYYGEGMLAPNGKIYMPGAETNTTILVLTPSSTTPYGTATTIASAGAYNGWGGVLGPNGILYYPTTNNVSTINPDTNAVATIPTSSGTSVSGLTLAGNGLIYTTTNSANTMGVIIPSSTSPYGTYSTISGTLGTGYGPGVLAPNGYLYFIGPSILVVFPSSSSPYATWTTVGSGFSNYSGGVVGADGKIYFSPYPSGNILIVTPLVSSPYATYTTSSPVTGPFMGLKLAPNGNIYGAPNNTTTILKIGFTGLTKLPSSNYCLSAWTNKF